MLDVWMCVAWGIFVLFSVEIDTQEVFVADWAFWRLGCSTTKTTMTVG